MVQLSFYLTLIFLWGFCTSRRQTSLAWQTVVNNYPDAFLFSNEPAVRFPFLSQLQDFTTPTGDLRQNAFVLTNGRSGCHLSFRFHFTALVSFEGWHFSFNFNNLRDPVLLLQLLFHPGVLVIATVKWDLINKSNIKERKAGLLTPHIPLYSVSNDALWVRWHKICNSLSDLIYN